MPSSKCKKSKATSVHKLKPKASTVAPLVVPSKVLPATPVEPVAPAIVPRVAPPLPKPRPADLNTDTPMEAHVPVAPVPPPQVAKPLPPVVVPVTPPAPPPATDQGQASACLAALAATGASFTP
ncbi:MAG: hypothetical protein ABI230_03490, partial [Aestuariivirga sp.]